jgi:hypothetical protein
MATAVAAPAAPRSRRSFWIRQVTLWHWVSSGLCLGAMLLFTVTGITLNHAGAISSEAVVTKREAKLPGAIHRSVREEKLTGKLPLPPGALAWIAAEYGERPAPDAAEWSEEEVYVSLPKPGGDAWLTIDRASGAVKYERTDRGWISYFNDLHKGRHTGFAWFVFIDIVAAACLVFTVSGLVLLQVHAAKRPSTWPLILAGLATPLVLMMFFIHV